MIRLDGYYSLEPIQLEDSIANYSYRGYHHKAFLFRNDGKYIIASTVNQSTEHFFKPYDFDVNFPNNYLLDTNRLIVIHCTGEEWEFSEIFEKVNDNLYKNEKQKLMFTNWQEKKSK